MAGRGSMVHGVVHFELCDVRHFAEPKFPHITFLLVVLRSTNITDVEVLCKVQGTVTLSPASPKVQSAEPPGMPALCEAATWQERRTKLLYIVSTSFSRKYRQQQIKR